MKLLAKICVFLLLAATLSLPASANKQHPINFVNQFKQSQDRLQEADKTLIDNMECIADWLVQFRHKFGHFPEPGADQEKAANYLLKKLLKSNPYTVTGIASAAEQNAACPLRFIQDSGPIDIYRQNWEKKVPNDWKAPPGSITIITNESNKILIWGAGADHLPIFDSRKNKYYFSWRCLNL